MSKVLMDECIDTNGTSYVGEFLAPYNSLCKLLGEPNGCPSGDNKVSVEWIGEIDGEAFTIYNWKDGKNYLGEEDGLDNEEITEWNIGGFKKSVAILK